MKEYHDLYVILEKKENGKKKDKKGKTSLSSICYACKNEA